MEEKTKEQLEQEKKEKSELRKKKAKRFFKIFGFSLLGVFGVAVIAVLGTWITGGFSTEPIAITSMSVEAGVLTDGSTAGLLVVDNEVLIMGDKSYTTKVSYAPEDANQLALTVKVKEGKNLLKSIPSVTAGKNFTLEFKTDENGKPLGGKIELQFTNSNGLVNTTLKILVDSELTNEMLTLSATDTTTNQNGNYLMAVTNEVGGSAEKFKLSSSNASAYLFKPGFVEFNDAYLNGLRFKKSYVFTSDGTKLKYNGLMYDDYANNAQTFDLLPVSAGVDVKVMTYTHKTFIMQSAFNENWLLNIINGNLQDFDYAGYNGFLNTYKAYIANTDESNAFFADKLNDEGLIELNAEHLLESLKYVFVVNDANCLISDVEIDEISVKGGTIEYSVFSSLNYDTNTITINSDDLLDEDYFGIQLKSKSNSELDNSILQSRLKDLLIAPYIETNETYDSAQKVNVNGVTYPKYFVLNTKVYKYNDEYLKVIKTNNDGKTQWTINALAPNLDNTNLYLGIMLSSVTNTGAVEYDYALQHVGVKYNTSSLSFVKNEYLVALNDAVANFSGENYEFSLSFADANDINKNDESFNKMEYKKILWVIPATVGNENYIKVLEESGLYTNSNKIIYLVDMDGDAINHRDGSNAYYLVGEDADVNIQALNASENKIPLYAMVMQTTQANGEGDVCYIEEAVEGNTVKRSYKVVIYSETPTEINITRYLDTIYTYYKNAEGKFKLCNGEENALVISPNGTGTLYVSGMLLNEDGTPIKIVRNEGTGQDEEIPLSEYEVKNIKIAYKNYLNAFGNKVCYRVKDTSALNPTTTNTGIYENENYITVNIGANSNVTSTDFTVLTDSDGSVQTSLPYVSGGYYISLIKIANEGV